MSLELQDRLNEILKEIPNAREGLPLEIFYFISQLTPMINVDLLIKNEKSETLLTWRADRFYGPAWHIPGGIIRFKENIEDRVLKVSQSELGANVRFLPEPIFVRNLINHTRDIRGHFISMLFLCELTSPLDSSLEAIGGVPAPGQWKWHPQAPDDLLTNQEVFRKYINETKPINGL